MATGNFVAYYRVSTKKQGDSGLGLEAQKEMVARYLNGGDWKQVGEFRDIESGTRKGCNRPGLKAALEKCKTYGATLIIAKLDRLSRSVAQVARMLDEATVKFVVADSPNDDKMVMHMKAVVGEWEADAISKRTKDALQAKKERGEPTGATCWKTPTAGVLSAENQKKGRELAAARIREKSDEFAARIKGKVEELRAENPSISLRGIAAALDDAGIPTMKGGKWAAATVKKIMER